MGKRITFPKNADHSTVIKVLENVYPKLCIQNGALDLLKAEKGGRHCKLVEIAMSVEGFDV